MTPNAGCPALTRILVPIIALAATLGPAQAVTHVVQVNSLSFNPATLTIQVGDTVLWQRVLGIHDVVSGSDCVGDGLFEAPINAMNPTFSFTFTSPGVVPYVCMPHCAFGMEGVITVEGTSEVPGGPKLELPTLSAPYPNPSRDGATVRLSSRHDTEVTVRILDASGRVLRDLVSGEMRQGEHDLWWDGRDTQARAVPSGIYYISVRSRDRETSVPVLILH
ncbi:MAG: T9SS type A sorting domain-containing protein [Candidatus Eisenbacteria bacterium]|nr:T9SS type A sorting domain-containing protein [Candidatus Eisenbacteria bacterium]